MLFLKPFAEKALQIPIICTFEINNSTLQALLAGSYALRAELNWELSALRRELNWKLCTTRRELTHYVRGHYTHKLKTIVLCAAFIFLFYFLFNYHFNFHF